MDAQTDPLIALRQLDRACRAGFLLITLFFAYFSIRLSFSIHAFEMIFSDMLGGRPLPWITEFIVAVQPVFVLLSLGLPLCAVMLALKVRRPDKAILGISLCSLILFLMSILMWTGLIRPLFSIITSLTG